MKRFFLVVAIILTAALFSIKADAQPRAFGVRMGSAFESSYQQCFGGENFLQVDLGLDLVGRNGVKATASYNFILAHPEITGFGEWSIYAGPGVSIGYVGNKIDSKENGFMACVLAQIGLEFCPIENFAVTVDVRPHYGYQSKTKGLYDGGLYGLFPALGLRLKF